MISRQRSWVHKKKWWMVKFFFAILVHVYSVWRYIENSKILPLYCSAEGRMHLQYADNFGTYKPPRDIIPVVCFARSKCIQFSRFSYGVVKNNSVLGSFVPKCAAQFKVTTIVQDGPMPKNQLLYWLYTCTIKKILIHYSSKDRLQITLPDYSRDAGYGHIVIP